MRIPGSNVYRAFPELDRFTDEQCVRFVRATKRAWWVVRVARLAALVGAFVLTLAISGAACQLGVAMLTARGVIGMDTNWGIAVLLLSLVTPVVLAIMTTLLVRDFMLRRLLRTVINERARCLGCGYSLLGARVSDDLKVICPECGAITEVDQSIAELQQGPGGAEFRPTVKVTIATVSPERRRRRKRAAIAVVAVFALAILSPIVYLGWNELAMRSDARKAAAIRPGAAGLQPLINALPPNQTDNARVAWDVFDNVLAAIDDADNAVWRNQQGKKYESGDFIRPDYSAVGHEVRAYGGYSINELRETQLLAERMLPALREHGAFDLMRSMRDAADRSPRFNALPGQLLIFVQLPELTKSRELARINRARAFVALRENNPAEFVDAVKNIHALARMCERTPTVMARMVSVSIDANGDGVCRQALMTGPGTAEWIDAVEQAQSGRQPQVPYAYAIQTDGVCITDTICDYYEDVPGVRRKQFELLKQRWERDSGVKNRMGRLDEALAATARRTADAIAASKLEFHARPPRSTAVGADLWAVQTLSGGQDRAQSSVDRSEADRRGTIIMIALERHRLATGGYPDSLDKLVPAHLTAVPIDSWTGKPYLYRKLDPKTDPDGRGYLLYVAGIDGTDNGGTTEGLDPLYHRNSTGSDYIINDPSVFK